MKPRTPSILAQRTDKQAVERSLPAQGDGKRRSVLLEDHHQGHGAQQEREPARDDEALFQRRPVAWAIQLWRGATEGHGYGERARGRSKGRRAGKIMGETS
jgi:hypothetical protein